MSGTIRKDRPWVRLLFSEKTIMRCHSVYYNTPEIRERYEQLPGGLNRMTLARFQHLLKSRLDLEIQSFQVKTLFGNAPIGSCPGVNEFFASSVSARCMKKR
jgi:hypothetical protein